MEAWVVMMVSLAMRLSWLQEGSAIVFFFL